MAAPAALRRLLSGTTPASHRLLSTPGPAFRVSPAAVSRRRSPLHGVPSPSARCFASLPGKGAVPEEALDGAKKGSPTGASAAEKALASLNGAKPTGTTGAAQVHAAANGTVPAAEALSSLPSKGTAPKETLAGAKKRMPRAMSMECLFVHRFGRHELAVAASHAKLTKSVLLSLANYMAMFERQNLKGKRDCAVMYVVSLGAGCVLMYVGAIYASGFVGEYIKITIGELAETEEMKELLNKLVDKGVERGKAKLGLRPWLYWVLFGNDTPTTPPAPAVEVPEEARVSLLDSFKTRFGMKIEPSPPASVVSPPAPAPDVTEEKDEEAAAGWFARFKRFF